MNRFTNISNTELAEYIENWVRGERDRQIMKRRLIDCIGLEALGEEFGLTVDRIKQIVYKWQKVLSKQIPEYIDYSEWVTLYVLFVKSLKLCQEFFFRAKLRSRFLFLFSREYSPTLEGLNVVSAVSFIAKPVLIEVAFAVSCVNVTSSIH